jgi:hypothetical protein
MPLIQLFYTAGVSLIIPCHSGVLYSNQTGGHGCLHPEVEGVCVPLFPEGARLEEKLGDFFTGPKWQGWCSEGIDSETADYIDTALEESDRTKEMTVNRTRLNDSHEAWIHLNIPDSKTAHELSIFRGFNQRNAILTWSNSD